MILVIKNAKEIINAIKIAIFVGIASILINFFTRLLAVARFAGQVFVIYK